MISDNLYKKILLEPAEKGCDKLSIVSGYATGAMAFHHLSDLKKINLNIEVNLIVGMCSKDGLSKSNHRSFQKLMDEDFVDIFTCSYIPNFPPVHSKTYVWFKGNAPSTAFIGSANYTQTAFFNQRELMSECLPKEANDYFDSFNDETIYCNHIDAENFVTIYKDQKYSRTLKQKKLVEDKLSVISAGLALDGLPYEEISLLDRQGKLPVRSGLNWGQRPEQHREPNQAYIRLPSSIYHTDFFPKVTEHFTVYTDDDKVLICTRAQDNGKAIQTPHNNSLLGKYFRERLGISLGQRVTKTDLENYGRTNVVFYKIDDETYYMDFSKPVKV